MSRIHVDRQSCTGHAQCVVHGPEVYVLDDDGFNCTPDKQVDSEYEKQAAAGAQACPEQAIVIATHAGGEA
jgi:ferredoxin